MAMAPIATSSEQVYGTAGTAEISGYFRSNNVASYNDSGSAYSAPYEGSNAEKNSFESITSEIAPLEQLRSFIQSARVSFVREMSNGLLESAISSYESSNWEELGQAIVDWASTLELESDPALMRRLRRRRTTT